MIDKKYLEMIRLALEFHRWGDNADGVTESGYVYSGALKNPRDDTRKLESLCSEIAVYLREGPGLPSEASTLLTAGRMYRRSADYAKACEYFLRALDLFNRMAAN